MSLVPVMSITPYIVYSPIKNSLDFTPLFRHFSILLFGLSILFMVSFIRVSFIKTISFILYLIGLGLLVWATLRGVTIGGKTASRWVSIFGIMFQPSLFMIVALGVYVASHLSEKEYKKKNSIYKSLVLFWTPVFIAFVLVAYNNLSMGMIMITIVLILCFVAKYPFDYFFTASILGIVIMCCGLFVATQFFKNNRISIWTNRLVEFASSDNKTESLQKKTAKMAIASGGIAGKGVGKGTVKNILAEGNTDFMYASIVEELGLAGGVFIIFLYIVLFINILSVADNVPNLFTKLLVLASGIPIILQAFINIGVSLSVLPITGQSLPFFNTSGSSIIVTFFSMGLILSANKEITKNRK